MTFFLTLSIFILPTFLEAATMTDYCINAPFVVGGVTPNLLMMFDNSSSMYDLNYVDKGYGTCSASAQQCGTGLPNCPVGQTCVLSRQPIYCYDKTFKSTNKYSGYFDDATYYQYNFTDMIFVSPAAFPLSCTYSISNILCVQVSAGGVTGFVAKGNYLNWLTSSKYDVQKFILTGGKYVDKTCSVSTDVPCTTAADCPASEACSNDVANYLMSEGRGCVGRKYIKEPITGDYVEGVAPTDLGITFGVRGPEDPYDATALSRGGQTSINIYEGNYDQQRCSDAINNILTGAQKQTTTDSISKCLEYTKGKTCSLLTSRACSDDTDCPNTAGACNVVSNGDCEGLGGGTCGPSGGGTCTPNNGTCTGTALRCDNDISKTCTKKSDCAGSGKCVATSLCAGGANAGAVCTSNSQCQLSTCTAGKPAGTICTTHANCNIAHCTAGKPNTTQCTANSDCNISVCENFGKWLDPCTVNDDCNTAIGTCSAGKPATTTCSRNTDCDNYTGFCAAPGTTQIASTFGQSMHSCYQYRVKGTAPDQNDINQISNPNGCNQTYQNQKFCIGGSNNGNLCRTIADCPGGGLVCRGGPDTLLPGSPVLVCSQKYAGYCASNPVNDDWATTSWVSREYASSNDCIIAKYKEYCGDLDVPPVVDPTDDPSNTADFSNVPAILGDMGLGGQLGDPIGTIVVNQEKLTEPKGLLQQFSDKIRFGALSFQYNGTNSECNKYCSNDHARQCTTKADCLIGGDQGLCNYPVPCPMKCSLHPDISCTTYLQCPSKNQSVENCVATTRGTDNRDGGTIIHYIGDPGQCSNAPATTCSRDTDCGAGACISVGNHNYGLINTVDKLKATSWTPFAEAFYNATGYFGRTNSYSLSPPTSNINLRLNGDSDFVENKNPSQFDCQANNILLITDGASTADLNSTVSTFASAYTDSGTTGACPKYAGSMNVDNISWIAKHRNIKQLVSTPAIAAPATSLTNSESINTYVVFTGADDGLAGDCNSINMMNQTAANGGTTSAKIAEDPQKLYDALKESFQTIASGAASGTAASVLASGEGSGANLIQALFYTVRDTFGATIIDPGIKWTGTIKNLWYYIDPFIGSSSIREDAAPKDYVLNINQDKIANFRFAGDETVVDLYADANGDGVKDSPASPSPKDVAFEAVSSLWEAGALLWARAASNRTIYTFDGTSFIGFPSSIGAGSPLISLLQAANDKEATAIAKYVRGEDVSVCSISKKTCNTVADCTPVVPGETCDAYRSRTVNSNVWKLGDIINSTPRIASWAPQNMYHKTYLDGEYKKFIASSDYRKRGMVFTGANDGMLHAFYLGQLELFSQKFKKAALTDPYAIGIGKELWAYIPKNALPYLKYMADNDYCHIFYADATPFIVDASINSCGGGDYWNCPKQTKCGVNAACTPTNNSLDVANTSWRTVIIGSMRLGGGCKDPASTSTLGVKTPLAGEGYSSYFALDISDTLAHPEDPSGHPPVLLWEFSNANIPAAELATGGLGFSTTGPAILRVATKGGLGNPDNQKNGKFFVVIGSGPTGPIDTTQFRGYSDQPLKLFVLDLKTGDLLRTFNETDLGIKNAFAGSMMNSMLDVDQNKPTNPGFYQDDAIYFGYTKAEKDPLTPSTKWTRGGVMRLFTKNEIDPSLWVVSKVMDDPLDGLIPVSKNDIVGPVTAAVSRLQNYTKNTLRLFFGSGRYYYKIASDLDDANPTDIFGADVPRRLYGVIEPCFDTLSGAIDFGCSTTVSLSSLSEAASASGTSDAQGWYINLDICTKGDGFTPIACYTTDGMGNTIPNPDAKYKAERNVTDVATTPMGAVFFTTTKPAADVCSFGGGTHLWAVQYETGGQVKAGVLMGKAIVQVSTGEIREVNLKSAFTERNGRRTDVIPGVPPAGSPPGLIVPPKPTDKIIHIRER